ncbi:MAG: lysylphosphatidylglycerol synthase transmembrane domain-containing protein [Candidatus Aenigmatarchaeota archaeon]
MIPKNMMLKFSIGIVILVVLLFFAGLQEAVNVLFTLNPYLVLAAFGITFFTMSFRFLRWKYVLTASSVKVPFGQIMRIFMIGFFFGTITPSKIGNLVKFHYLKKYYKIRTSRALSLSLADRIFDILIIVAMSVIGVIFIFTSFSNVIMVAISIAVLLVAVFVVLNERIFKKIARIGISKLSFIKRLLKETKEVDLDSTTENFYDPFRQIKKLKNFTPVLLFSILVWLSVGLQTTLILNAMGYNVGFVHATLFIAMGTLVGLVPITASGLGVREGVFALLLTTIGLPLNVGVLASLIAFLLGQLPPAIVGLGVYTIYKKKE